MLIHILAACLTTPEGALQEPGGEWTRHFSIAGWETWMELGEAVASLGDINADGADDLAMSSVSASLGGVVNYGCVVVYSGADGSLLLRVNGASQSSWFGYDMDGTGDVDGDGVGDFVVSALCESAGSGSVYVFSGSDGRILHHLQNPDPYTSYFGRSVAGAGDVDADGHGDLLVGHTDAHPGGYHSAGSAFVYSGRTGSLLYRFDGVRDSQCYGGTVAGAGDVDRDGHADILIGNYTPAFAVVGAVDLYSGATGALLFSWAAGTGANFGCGLAAAGDVNADGWNDLVVGQNYYDPPGGPQSAGTVYVFSGFDGSQLHQFIGGSRQASIGKRVDGAGDVNGDGFSDVIVGSEIESPTGTWEGSMKIYSGRDGGELLAVFGAGRYHGMGSDVCGAGDMNGNGLPEFVVSARGEGVVGIPHCGRVYVGGFSPLMTSSSETVSASQGGVIVLSLDFAPADAGATYQLLGSERGKGPDVFMGLTIPLTIGGWLWNALLTNPPPAFSSTRGRLDADGDAAIFITLPPGALTQWVGATAHFASVLIDPLQRVPVKTSVAVPLMINP